MKGLGKMDERFVKMDGRFAKILKEIRQLRSSQ